MSGRATFDGAVNVYSASQAQREETVRSGTVESVEITVRLDDGSLRAVTQSVEGPMFHAGERVRLLSSGGVTRVTV
ncbi:hypothetical protein GCT13_01795 [Paraburkholderia sp. CNPSo 3157]|uniref:Uncharacterized protein n=1 Tax=Paraburkholderia franconis TaxID=2654983 RepID=A0A7X1N5F3_9BURK|nr:hypothetical protein [Paraburkholderia franconis]MPW15677.1 hypothetical protein [Paraburkholderia franconis]